MNTKSVIADLDRQYNKILILPEKAFFVSLAGYVRSAHDIVNFDSLLKKLNKNDGHYFESVRNFENQKVEKAVLKAEPKSFEDYIEIGKELVKKKQAVEDVLRAEQTSLINAWMKLEEVYLMIYDKNVAEEVYRKINKPKAQFYFKQASQELDSIIKLKEDLDDEQQIDKKINIPRSIFIKDDYINYLTQVHEFLLHELQNIPSSNPVIFSPEQSVVYQNKVLFFKLGDGTHDSIDFSNAPEIRKVFECLWELRKRTSHDTFKPLDIINIYQELFGKDIDRHFIASQISHIRSTKINPKPHLKQRFQIKFDKDTESWHSTLF